MICHLTSHFCSRINCPNIQGDEMFPIILLMVLTLIRPNTLLSLTSRKSFLFISLKIILVRRPSSEFYLFGLHIEMHLLPFCVFFMIRNSFGCEQCGPPFTGYATCTSENVIVHLIQTLWNKFKCGHKTIIDSWLLWMYEIIWTFLSW